MVLDLEPCYANVGMSRRNILSIDRDTSNDIAVKKTFLLSLGSLIEEVEVALASNITKIKIRGYAKAFVIKF